MPDPMALALWLGFLLGFGFARALDASKARRDR